MSNVILTITTIMHATVPSGLINDNKLCDYYKLEIRTTSNLIIMFCFSG